MRISPLAYVLPGATALALSLAFAGCTGDPDASSPGPGATDGGSSSRKDGASGEGISDDGSAANDAETKDASSSGEGGCAGPIVTTPGETCVGFGAKGDSCDPTCGQSYGYVCFGGAPPGFAGCRKVSESAFGQTYCCSTNDCVAQPDLDALCSAVGGKPHRFQCPPDGDGGNVAAPAGCEENGSGSSEVEKFYCCP